MISDEEILEGNVRRAQEIGKSDGFKPGDAVCHPSDKKIWRLKRIEKDQAVVFLKAKESGTGKRETRKFPLEGLFSFKTLRNLTFDEELARALPEGSKVIRID